MKNLLIISISIFVFSANAQETKLHPVQIHDAGASANDVLKFNGTNWTPSAVATSTDDQTIDVFSLAGSVLSISLESDGETSKTVDLSSIQTAAQDLTYNASTGVLDISGGNTATIEIGELFVYEDFLIGATSSTLTAALSLPNSLNGITVYRNGLAQRIATAGTTKDVTVNLATKIFTFNFRDLGSGEIINIQYPKQ